MCFPAFIFDVDASTTLEDDLVTVMLKLMTVVLTTPPHSYLLYRMVPVLIISLSKKAKPLAAVVLLCLY